MTLSDIAKEYYQQLSVDIARASAGRRAPWYRAVALPRNPVTGMRFRALNTLALLARDRAEPYWLTTEQGAELGGVLRHGAEPQPVQAWKRRGENWEFVLGCVYNAADFEGLELPRPSGRDISPAELLGDSTDHDHDPDFRADALRGQALLALRSIGFNLRLPFGSRELTALQLRERILTVVCAGELGWEARTFSGDQYFDRALADFVLEDPLNFARAARDAELAFQQAPELACVRAVAEENAMRVHEQVRLHTAARRPITASRLAPAAPSVLPGRHYLAVPFSEKEPAAEVGVIWDKARRASFVTFDLYRANPELFGAWEKGFEASVVSGDPAAQFAAFLRELGFEADVAHLTMDGRKRRMRVGGDSGRQKSGQYATDGKSGWAKNWREAKYATWGATLDFSRGGGGKARIVENAWRAQWAYDSERRRVATEARLVEVAHDLARVVDSCEVASERTGYLERKGVDPTFDVRIDRRGVLLLPAYDSHGALWTVQYIDPDGEKLFAFESRSRACFHPLDPPRTLARAELIVVAEGYATAASVRAATGCCAVAAFYADNLRPVAEALRAQYPRAALLIAGDDDRRLVAMNKPNRGRLAAQDAAVAVGGVAAFPVFAEGEDGLTDWNDLEQTSKLGSDAVARQLAPFVRVAKQQVSPAQIRERKNIETVVNEQGLRLQRGARGM